MKPLVCTEKCVTGTPKSQKPKGSGTVAELVSSPKTGLTPAPSSVVGLVSVEHEAVMADWPDLSGHQVYACGAPVMVDAAQRDFVARCGLPTEAFFADAFTSAADKAGD